MSITAELKRQNFNITPEQEADIMALQSELDAPSAKDAILRAVHLALVVGREIRKGRQLGFREPDGQFSAVLLPEFEANVSAWTYLVPRPHHWKKQLFIKGRKLTAAQVWLDMQANQMSRDEAADNWDLPVEAVDEVIRYCEQNHVLLQMEAAEERLFLESNGVNLTAPPQQQES
jgi:uncharacterized protein (DUF433 family)